MLILLEILALVNLNFSQPVYPPVQKVAVNQAEYIQKPLLVTTIITPPEPPRARVSVDYEIVRQDSVNNCVFFAKAETGIYRTMGAGGRLAINSQEPQVGKIGSLKGFAHAVVIEKVEGDMITFRESNYRKNLITRRTLPRSQFLGFII